MPERPLRSARRSGHAARGALAAPGPRFRLIGRGGRPLILQQVRTALAVGASACCGCAVTTATTATAASPAEAPTAPTTASDAVGPPSLERGSWVAKIVRPTTAVPVPGSSRRGVPVTTIVDGRARLRARVVVGAPATPTPRGLFAVLLTAKQRDPRGFLGPWALHLTSHSDVLDDYGGGPGRVAIHGRDGSSLRDPLGTARSHGCVRIANADVARLARWLRPGTPVRITR